MSKEQKEASLRIIKNAAELLSETAMSLVQSNAFFENGAWNRKTLEPDIEAEVVKYEQAISGLQRVARRIRRGNL